MDIKRKKRIQRHKRVRAKVRGTSDCPRLSVFKSNRHMFLQLIDDDKNETIIGLRDKDEGKKSKGTKTQKARELGERLAKEAANKKIKKAVFDRGGFRYHGRVSVAAEGAREGGLEF